MSFSPCLYNFTIPTDIEEKTGLSPPLWALIDHVVAVVYYIYSPNSKLDPDMSQLQWVLGFLNAQSNGCDKYDNLNCLKNLLHSVIMSKMRSPAFLPVKNFDTMNTLEVDKLMEGVEAGEESDATKLTLPLTLVDILSNQPKEFQLKLSSKYLKDIDEENPLQSICPNTAQSSRGQGPYAGKPMCNDTPLTDDKALSEYLQMLKQHQDQVLKQEQQTLQLIDMIKRKYGNYGGKDECLCDETKKTSKADSSNREPQNRKSQSNNS